MKKFGIIMMFVAAVAFTSCSSLTGSGSTSAAAKSGGQCAKAMVGLFNSYQKAGTISITNPADLANIVTLLNSYTELKNHKDDSSFKSEFAKGMALQGAPVINSSNATSLMNSLLGAAGLSTNINTASIAEKAQTVQTIISLIQMLK